LLDGRTTDASERAALGLPQSRVIATTARAA
jgi:hypothetical protein